MKRVVFIFLLSISLFCTILGIINAETVTGEITGELISASSSLNISIVGSPALSIISPENETYLTTKNLLLNYSALSADFVWYNLDNTAPNNTLTAPIYFNATEGNHTLYLYANNSYGEVSENVTFTANLKKFVILYSEYNGSTRGSSTDFILYTYEGIQNLSNIILEHTEYGKIKFNEAVNITNDANLSDNKADLDINANISDNRIELDSTALPNFNKSATLWLYNLSFSNPRILRDGSVCPSTICTQESYTGGTLKTLKFNVTGFTVYSVEETPAVTPPPTLPGGGGRRRVVIKKDFSTDKEDIRISLKQGETKKESIIIKNTGNIKIKINLENPKLKDFMEMNETEFYLEAGESKIIILDFLAKENTIPDLYIGTLIIKGGGIEKEILIAIEVETEKPLFDVRVKIPNRFLYVLPGEDLQAKIELFNLGATGSIDIDMDYSIKDSEGNDILSEHETITIETRMNFMKSFKIPENAKYEKYILYVKATYNQDVASSSAWFNVGEKPFFTFNKILLISITSILLIVLLIFYISRKIKKELEHPLSKVSKYRLSKKIKKKEGD